MKKITSISLFNTPILGTNIELAIEPGKNVLILTGYNGSGKSRTIGVILETLSLLRDENHDVTSYDWIVELVFEKEMKLRALKMTAHTYSPTEMKNLIEEEFTNSETIEHAYNRVQDIVSEYKPAGSFKSKSEKENRAFACVGLSPKNRQSIEDFGSEIEAVAFIDSEIYFNYKREVAEEVMSRSSGINQTLYTLFFELAVRQVENPDVFNKVYSLLKEFEESSGGGDEEGARKYLKSKLDPSILENTLNALENTEVFIELNKFFALTNRKLRWTNKHAVMHLDNGQEIPWIYFSRGEKTLLALLLIVHLYSDSAIFLFDEPDLSLHMEWQRMLIPALTKLAPKSQFVISTHSPFMVMNTDCEQVVNMVNFSCAPSKRG
ncbi:ATP-binding protein [Pseudomonas iridis]|uniref:ATP-binding protein n=1 Tax=Pseudomonas iridis TaxID=2710587 RepID=UPI0021BFF52E|nr:ATP-binding protein [Pseudomonas iridis]MCT8950603.1 ATP-binding protein [Pseudomonas iridis]